MGGSDRRFCFGRVKEHLVIRRFLRNANSPFNKDRMSDDVRVISSDSLIRVDEILMLL